MRTRVSSSARMRGMSSLTRSLSVVEEACVFMEERDYSGADSAAQSTMAEDRFRCGSTWYPRDIDRKVPPKLNALHEETLLAESSGVHWLRDLWARARVLLHSHRDRRSGGEDARDGPQRRLAL